MIEIGQSLYFINLNRTEKMKLYAVMPHRVYLNRSMNYDLIWLWLWLKKQQQLQNEHIYASKGASEWPASKWKITKFAKCLECDH